MQDAVSALPTTSAFSTSLLPTSIPPALSQPIHEIGAHFFFANYTCDEPPLSEGYYSWLTQKYFEEPPNDALRAAVEAAGMAGISNIFYAPQVASISRERYGRALSATNQALSNPVESGTDTTLITVIALGLFEFVTLDNWDHSQSWTAHIGGATALLQLRGPEQYNYERREQLFMLLRSQILHACMQQEIAAPYALLQLSRNFKISAIAHMNLRFLDLRAAIRRGDLVDPKAIYNAAIRLDGDLESWKAALEPSWSYSTVDAGDALAGMYFEGKRHLYNNLRTARIWNSWRTLRILVSQIILQNEVWFGATGSGHEYTALSTIHQVSTEICVSAPNFIGSPRSATFIWPLFVVSQEDLNPRSERVWAVKQLHRIGSSIGIRQAFLMANTISQSLNGLEAHLAKCATA